MIFYLVKNDSYTLILYVIVYAPGKDLDMVIWACCSILRNYLHVSADLCIFWPEKDIQAQLLISCDNKRKSISLKKARSLPQSLFLSSAQLLYE